MFANMDMYRIENVVCYPFRTANLVDNGTKEGQIGEGCMGSLGGQGAGTAKAVEMELGQDVAAILDMQENRDNEESCEEGNGGGFTVIPPMQNTGGTRLAKDM